LIASPELKNRVLAALASVDSPTRAEVRKARAWLLACGVVGAVAVFLFEGGIRVSSRPPSLVALTSLGTAVIAAAAIRLLFTRAQSMSGRRGSVLVTAAVASSLLFVAWRYGVSRLFGHSDAWPERPGLRCLALSLGTGALPLLAALLSWRRTRSVTPVATGAAFGAGVGLGTALLVDLWCPVSYLPHLLLGHLLPVGILAVLGGTLGWWLLRMRWRESGCRCAPGTIAVDLVVDRRR
jgi:hypothetical protein